ncbi:hypothetical protein [Janibacter alittae]|uniref:Uncharacterized protein n=1 Tax=Janibacter alittae TaxID=3115209 RepID=A0ABZ2MH83_9MICO
MRSVPALAFVLNLFICAWALLKGFYIEPTTAALEESAQGQRMALLAVPGLVLAAAGLIRHRWAAVAGGLSLLLGVAALVVALL